MPALQPNTKETVEGRAPEYIRRSAGKSSYSHLHLCLRFHSIPHPPAILCAKSIRNFYFFIFSINRLEIDFSIDL